MSTPDAPRDKLSPLLSLTTAERTAARARYAVDPAPFDALIADVLALVDHGAATLDAIAVTVAREGRAG